jgi:hypothetical protein
LEAFHVSVDVWPIMIPAGLKEMLHEAAPSTVMVAAHVLTDPELLSTVRVQICVPEGVTVAEPAGSFKTPLARLPVQL